MELKQLKPIFPQKIPLFRILTDTSHLVNELSRIAYEIHTLENKYELLHKELEKMVELIIEDNCE